MSDMGKKVIEVPELADSRHWSYEQCIRIGDRIEVAGQTGVDENYNVVSKEFEPQTRQTFKNVGHALNAAGASLADVTRMSVYLTDMRYAEKFATEIRPDVLGSDLPVSSLIGVDHLALPGLLIEIEVSAYSPQ